MQLGNVWLKMNQFGSNVYKKDVTPAECVLLSNPHKDGTGHAAAAGGNPLSKLEVTGEAKKLTFDTEDMVMLPGHYELQPDPNDENKTVKVFVGEKVARTDAEELARLKQIYTAKVVELMFPGAAPTLPQKFADVTLPTETVTVQVTPVLDPTAKKEDKPMTPPIKVVK